MRRRRIVFLVLGLAVGAAALTTFTGTDGSSEELTSACRADPGGVACSLLDPLQELETYWHLQPPPPVTLVSGSSGSCGGGSSEEGSFYCSDDGHIYLQQEDFDTFDGLAKAVADASAVYLLAHEYAHAVQDSRGLDDGSSGLGPSGSSVRYELQADCLAGVWLKAQGPGQRAAYVEAVRLGGDDVGEDPLPVKEYGHGSAQQRVRWFTRGLDTGRESSCATSGAVRL